MCCGSGPRKGKKTHTPKKKKKSLQKYPASHKVNFTLSVVQSKINWHLKRQEDIKNDEGVPVGAQRNQIQLGTVRLRI